MAGEAGKGPERRPENGNKYREGWDLAFGKYNKDKNKEKRKNEPVKR